MTFVSRLAACLGAAICLLAAGPPAAAQEGLRSADAADRAALAVGLPVVGTASAGSAIGSWVLPLAGPKVLLRRFDPPVERWSGGHRGVDLAGAEGDPVLAAGAGRVTFAALVAGRGVVVVAHDDGTRTTYEPVRAAVRVGDLVVAGQPIGTLVRSGSHCEPGACLHWGRLRGAVYLDPMLLLRPATVRLLPVWG